jgi:hypothetical protein
MEELEKRFFIFPQVEIDMRFFFYPTAQGISVLLPGIPK